MSIRVTILRQETIVYSLVKDCITFGFLMGLFWFNETYLGGSWAVSIIGTLMMLVAMAGVASRADLVKGMFRDPKDAIEYIKSQTGTNS